MFLSPLQQSLLTSSSPAMRKSMQILVALGKIYNARQMIPVASVQVAGVSYDNLGEAGLEFLAEMAAGGAHAQVLTTLNPAGMDIDAWQGLGIEPEFAARQQQVIEAFTRMGILPTCTCTPYLVGNLPHFGEHVAWAESSAVCFANSVLGARTNREGGPSALASALTGLTPEYGYHLEENRRPTLTVDLQAGISGSHEFGALGIAIGRAIERAGVKPIPFIQGIPAASLEELKSLCASMATYGGAALFHIQGITPEAGLFAPPSTGITLTRQDIDSAIQSVSVRSPGSQTDGLQASYDFVTLGCPHLSIHEIERVARLLQGRKVKREFWITTARPTRAIAERMGYLRIIEEAGAKVAADTCCVVAPIGQRFTSVATDSAKACFYAAAKHKWDAALLPFDQVVEEALK